jgi:adenine deaminase
MRNFQMEGWFADFDRQNFYYGEIRVLDGRIAEIRETGSRRKTWDERELVKPVILPGLVDAHAHIESTLIMPSRFARQAVRFGTLATVADPHEIANVLGLDGIRLMMKDAEQACMKIHFTAPSCVPATLLESAGARLEATDLEELFAQENMVALGEMMNYPGVLSGDPGVLDKINLSKKYGKPVDGHAPGLTGEQLDVYIGAGISTDHECTSFEEAEEKIRKGMKVIIREGSSDCNFKQLHPLIDKYPRMVMLCTDDFDPVDLMKGHIDRMIRMGVEEGVGFFNLYRAASLNPVEHYRLNLGTLKPGDPADFIVAGSLGPFEVTEAYLNGVPVYRNGVVEAGLPDIEPMNNFHAVPITPGDLEVKGTSGSYRVIRAVEGDLITRSEIAYMTEDNGIVQPDPHSGIQKIVVLNRYAPAKPAVAWITGFGLEKGAMASSIAHDSHNIIAVGTSDSEIADAINTVIQQMGGIAATESGIKRTLALPVAGLMSPGQAAEVAACYEELTSFVKGLGSALKAPFMTLSFMALLVIPHLKIGDQGLFDCDAFEFIDLKAD